MLAKHLGCQASVPFGNLDTHFIGQIDLPMPFRKYEAHTFAKTIINISVFIRVCDPHFGTIDNPIIHILFCTRLQRVWTSEEKRV